jgi:translation initiation factor 1
VQHAFQSIRKSTARRNEHRTSRGALQWRTDGSAVIIQGVKSYPTARGVVLRKSPSAPARAQSKPAAASASSARVRVAREVAGRGGKAVSVVLGLPLDAAELETLGRELKKLCGAGGAVREGRIEIQGEHRDRLVEALRQRGYDAKRSGG